MINDYSELIAEASHRSGIPGIATRARMFTGLAEGMLTNQLRLSRQEKTAEIITDANGAAALPADFHEIRSVKVHGRVLPANAHDAGYAISDDAFISRYKDTLHHIHYIAAIRGLDQETPHWLLLQEPEICLHALLMQIYIAESDVEKAATTASYLNSLTQQANSRAYINRLANKRIRLDGPTP